MCIEWLEDILREQAVIDTRVFVLFELGQLVLTDVNHGCEVSEERDEMLQSLLLLFCCVSRKITKSRSGGSWLVIAAMTWVTKGGAAQAENLGNDKRSAQLSTSWQQS
jgi:hypothetical protein